MHVRGIVVEKKLETIIFTRDGEGEGGETRLSLEQSSVTNKLIESDSRIRVRLPNKLTSVQIWNVSIFNEYISSRSRFGFTMHFNQPRFDSTILQIRCIGDLRIDRALNRFDYDPNWQPSKSAKHRFELRFPDLITGQLHLRFPREIQNPPPKLF